MKVRYLGATGALLFLCSVCSAQRVHYVFLKAKPITIENRGFYISNVEDDRIDTTTLGIVYVGLFKAHHRAVFPQACPTVLSTYFNKTLPDSAGQAPIEIRIKKFRIEERVAQPIQSGWVDMILAFYYRGRLVYQSVQHQAFTAKDVTKQHSHNIALALENAILGFNRSQWQSRSAIGPDGSYLPDEEGEVIEASTDEK